MACAILAAHYLGHARNKASYPEHACTRVRNVRAHVTWPRNHGVRNSELVHNSWLICIPNLGLQRIHDVGLSSHQHVAAPSEGACYHLFERTFGDECTFSWRMLVWMRTHGKFSLRGISIWVGLFSSIKNLLGVCVPRCTLGCARLGGAHVPRMVCTPMHGMHLLRWCMLLGARCSVPRHMLLGACPLVHFWV